MIGLVGKPSSGKSTTLNSLTDAGAKVGNFPFTTIDPNKAVGYTEVKCPCVSVGQQDRCKPNHGWCENGRRFVPVQLLDVAGLVPGAHEGRGLGNKFLDDLRHADALIHVVDASGTTDAEGKQTRGYDPIYDIEWLQDEIFYWIKGNLESRWGSIARRHASTKSSTVETLANQFSGYGASRSLVQRAVARADKIYSSVGNEKMGGLGPLNLWDDDKIGAVVRAFMSEKFPTVLALNKVDHPDADKNVAKIAKKHSSAPLVLASAISEVLLRKLAKQDYIRYEVGTEFVDTKKDLPDSDLKDMDPKLEERVETVRDLVLYRFGSTGVANALKEAVALLKLLPVYPVKSFHEAGTKTMFPDCLLVRRGTTIAEVKRKVMGDAPVLYVEGRDGLKLAEDDVIEEGKNNIFAFRTRAS